MKNFRNIILDASALIAFVYAEKGHDVVAKVSNDMINSA